MDTTRRQFMTVTAAGAAALLPLRAAKSQLKVICSTEDMAALSARWRRPDHGRIARPRLPGRALRRGQAQFHRQGPQRRPVDFGRTAARDRLAASLDHAEPQPERAARRSGVSRSLAVRRHPREARRRRQPRHGRHPSDGQSAFWLDPTTGGPWRKDSPTSSPRCVPMTPPTSPIGTKILPRAWSSRKGLGPEDGAVSRAVK